MNWQEKKAAELHHQKIMATLDRFNAGEEFVSEYDVLCHLIETDLTNARVFADKLLDRGRSRVGYQLADLAYGYNCDNADSKLWVHYVNRSASKSWELWDFHLIESTNPPVNECGFWVAKHVSDADFYGHLAIEYGIITSRAEVVQTFARHEGKRFTLSETEDNDTFPITATFNEDIQRRIIEDSPGRIEHRFHPKDYKMVNAEVAVELHALCEEYAVDPRGRLLHIQHRNDLFSKLINEAVNWDSQDIDRSTIEDIASRFADPDGPDEREN